MSNRDFASQPGPVEQPQSTSRRAARSAREVSADWIAKRNGGWSSLDEARFREWLAANPCHEEAFAEAEAVWTLLNRPRQSGMAEDLRWRVEKQARCTKQRRRFYLGMGATLAAAAALAFAFLPPDTRRDRERTSETIVLRPDRQILPDGSIVELNAGAQISVAFTADRRGVRLLKGEVLFSVVKDPTRAFVVSTGAVDVRAVGTTFSVRAAGPVVDVLVTKGRVAVENRSRAEGSGPSPAGGREVVYLDAGARGTATAGWSSGQEPLKISRLSTQELGAALAWRSHRVEFTETPVAGAVALFNRQNRIQITLEDASLGSRRITGIFWADDPEGFARLLQAGLNIRAHYSDQSIVLSNE